MAATSFSELYEFVRVATGNDDPVIGPEILPDTRIDVLLRTAALTLSSYSPSFPSVVADNSSLIVEGIPDTPIRKELKIAIVYVAAHKYFVGIGNTQAAREVIGMVYGAAEAISGQTTLGITEEDLALASRYKARKRADAASQSNLQ